MTDLQKVKIASVFSSARFWMILFDLYLVNLKSFSKEQVFLLITIFYLVNIILEFPTGVVGDYFSHKLSVVSGCFSLFLSIIFLIFFVNSFFSSVIFIFLGALGGVLISGSDSALLHSFSKDFKKDLSQLNSINLFFSAFATAVGSWLASLNFNYAFYLQALVFLIAIFFLLSVKSEKQPKEEGNIFATAKEGFKNVIFNKYLFHLTIISSLTTAFFLNIKWFFNPLFTSLDINVKFWGLLGGIGTLFVIFGSYFYKKFSEKSIAFSVILFLFFIFLMSLTNYFFLAIAGLCLVNLMRGFFSVKFNVDTNKIAKPTVRASVLSFQSFIVRLISMLIVFISGFILERFSFSVLIYVILLFFVISGFYSVIKVSYLEKELTLSKI